MTLTPETIIITLAIFLLAGTIKGIVGIGLPTTALSLMTLFLDPRTAIALVLVPMTVSNLWQVHRSGETKQTARRYAPFVLALVVSISIALMVTRDVNAQVLLGCLGAAILIFVFVNLSKWAPHIPEQFDRAAQIVAGCVAGAMGGLTAVWAPPMAVYLASRNAGKDEFVRATGFLIFFGSLPLTVGYVLQGFLTWPVFVISLALLIPTFAGFALGERLRGGLSEQGFRKVLLAFFFVMGVNLLRRAFFG